MGTYRGLSRPASRTSYRLTRSGLRLTLQPYLSRHSLCLCRFVAAGGAYRGWLRDNSSAKRQHALSARDLGTGPIYKTLSSRASVHVRRRAALGGPAGSLAGWRGENGENGSGGDDDNERPPRAAAEARGQEVCFRRTRHVCLQIGVLPGRRDKESSGKLGFGAWRKHSVMTVAVVPSRLALSARRRSRAKSGAGQPGSLRLAYRVARLRPVR